MRTGNVFGLRIGLRESLLAGGVALMLLGYGAKERAMVGASSGEEGLERTLWYEYTANSTAGVFDGVPERTHHFRGWIAIAAGGAAFALGLRARASGPPALPGS